MATRVFKNVQYGYQDHKLALTISDKNLKFTLVFIDVELIL